MPDRSYLDWPFFDPAHRELADAIDSWAADEIAPHEDQEDDVDALARSFVEKLGKAGWLEYCVPADCGGKFETLDVRSLCLIRETLARYSGLADFAFAMQGLGSASISLFGSDALKQKYVTDVGRGKRIGAFALSEPAGGSDVANMTTEARPYDNGDGDTYILNGTKTWISNGGIADQYVVFARTGEAPGAKGLSAFVVDADNPGLEISERIDVIAPHPLGTITFTDCRVPASHRLGEPGDGFKVSMSTLDIFRATVGASALGFARRALDEAIARAKAREAFGQHLSDMPVIQTKLAEMAVQVDAAALLVYRAAWTKDQGAPRVTREASMAKLYATESAQKVIDEAVQIHGGTGVVSGNTVERLYREIRALRIYEGTSEIQRLVIAGQTLAGSEGN
ncbi:MAG: acyl-CoA dehydrogenase family protein [Alphaproteobacteria bacterium]|nr:acyl-CoA dehydrogenase family protein [Alphaproteobacteria bacterium]